jgi:ketosteroid isomerase-like protein
VARISEQNVKKVREGVEAWNRRDAEMWLRYAAPEVEWMPAGPAAVERTVYRGYDQVAKGFESVWQTWDEFRFEESDVRDLGESVLWLGRVKMRGAASHVELDQEFAVRSVLRDGKFFTVQAFLAWADALKAVGLEE